MKKLYFVFNPTSGKAMIKNHLLDIVDTFTKAGYEVTIHPTQARLDAYNGVMEHMEGYDLIVCSGGDGTLNETISGYLDYDKKSGITLPPLGYIPAGTTNDFASSLGISKIMPEAAETVVNGIAFPCDMGCFNDRHFAYVAAFGAFTDVSYGTPQQTKNALGHMAYILEGIKRLPSIESFSLKIETPEQTVEGDYLFGMVSNTTSVGGFKSASTRILLDDGIFEMLLVKRPQSMIELQNTLSCLVKQDFKEEYFDILHVNKVKVTSDIEIPWTLDGEFGGSHNEIEIECKKQAVTIIIPDKIEE